MPFRDPTRVLILPPGASPPIVGQSVIVIDPGPPPIIKLYTGDPTETAPAFIRTTVSPLPGLFLAGPETSLVDAPYLLMRYDTTNFFAQHIMFADEWEWQDTTVNETLMVLTGVKASGSGFIRTLDVFGDDPNGQVFQVVDDHVNTRVEGFWSDVPQMKAIQDVNVNDVNGLVNTTYATPTGQLTGVAFRAPPSGRGIVSWYARFDFNFSGAAALNRSVRACAVLRTGSTIGAGSDPNLADFQATPNDDIAAGHAITHPTGTGAIGGPAAHGSFHVDGLTAGANYNVFLQAKCNSATTFTYDVLFQKIGWTPLY